MPKRSRLKRGSSKARSTRMTKMSFEDKKVKEILDFQGGLFETWDIRDLQVKALKEAFKKREGLYLSKYYAETHENKNVDSEYSRIKSDITRDFGSVQEYRRVHEYRNAKSWNSVDSVKGKEIRGRSMSGVFVTLPVDSMYTFSWMVLKDEILGDYVRVHQMFTDPQKEQYYSEQGYVETDLFNMKRYKNGSIVMTFKNEADAQKVFNEWKRLDKIYWANSEKVGG